MSIKLELPDGQDRYYSLVTENYLHCEFKGVHGSYNDPDGYCDWFRDEDGVWRVVSTSRGEGKAIAKPGFGDILDGIHLQLLAERELLDE